MRVREQIAGNPALIAIIEPLLAVWYAIREQVTMLDRQILARARNDQVARRLMTIPGVGVVTALAYTAVIDDPARFRRSVSVGAYLGLTPRRYQSGEVDTTGHISKCGDSLLRGYLYEAAAVLLYRDGRASILKSWGLGLANELACDAPKSRSRASSRSSCTGFGATTANTVGRRRYRRPPPENHARAKAHRNPPTLGRSCVPLGRGRATPRSSLRHASPR